MHSSIPRSLKKNTGGYDSRSQLSPHNTAAAAEKSALSAVAEAKGRRQVLAPKIGHGCCWCCFTYRLPGRCCERKGEERQAGELHRLRCLRQSLQLWTASHGSQPASPDTIPPESSQNLFPVPIPLHPHPLPPVDKCTAPSPPGDALPPPLLFVFLNLLQRLGTQD